MMEGLIGDDLPCPLAWSWLWSWAQLPAVSHIDIISDHNNNTQYTQPLDRSSAQCYLIRSGNKTTESIDNIFDKKKSEVRTVLYANNLWPPRLPRARDKARQQLLAADFSRGKLPTPGSLCLKNPLCFVYLG